MVAVASGSLTPPEMTSSVPVTFAVGASVWPPPEPPELPPPDDPPPVVTGGAACWQPTTVTHAISMATIR